MKLRSLFAAFLVLVCPVIWSGCASVPQVAAATTVFSGRIVNDGGGTTLPTFKTSVGQVYMLANAPKGSFYKGQGMTLKGRLEMIGSKNVQRALRNTYGSEWKEVQARSAHQVGGMVFLLEGGR